MAKRVPDTRRDSFNTNGSSGSPTTPHMAAIPSQQLSMLPQVHSQFPSDMTAQPDSVSRSPACAYAQRYQYFPTLMAGMSPQQQRGHYQTPIGGHPLRVSLQPDWDLSRCVSPMAPMSPQQQPNLVQAPVEVHPLTPSGSMSMAIPQARGFFSPRDSASFVPQQQPNQFQPPMGVHSFPASCSPDMAPPQATWFSAPTAGPVSPPRIYRTFNGAEISEATFVNLIKRGQKAEALNKLSEATGAELNYMFQQYPTPPRGYVYNAATPQAQASMQLGQSGTAPGMTPQMMAPFRAQQMDLQTQQMCNPMGARHMHSPQRGALQSGRTAMSPQMMTAMQAQQMAQSETRGTAARQAHRQKMMHQTLSGIRNSSAQNGNPNMSPQMMSAFSQQMGMPNGYGQQVVHPKGQPAKSQATISPSKDPPQQPVRPTSQTSPQTGIHPVPTHHAVSEHQKEHAKLKKTQKKRSAVTEVAAAMPPPSQPASAAEKGKASDPDVVITGSKRRLSSDLDVIFVESKRRYSSDQDMSISGSKGKQKAASQQPLTESGASKPSIAINQDMGSSSRKRKQKVMPSRLVANNGAGRPSMPPVMPAAQPLYPLPSNLHMHAHHRGIRLSDIEHNGSIQAYQNEWLHRQHDAHLARSLLDPSPEKLQRIRDNLAKEQDNAPTFIAEPTIMAAKNKVRRPDYDFSTSTTPGHELPPATPSTIALCTRDPDGRLRAPEPEHISEQRADLLHFVHAVTASSPESRFGAAEPKPGSEEEANMWYNKLKPVSAFVFASDSDAENGVWVTET